MGLQKEVKKRMGDKAPMEFSDQDKADFRKNFNLFDKKRTGAIPIGDMGTVLRSLGQNPTEAELAALMEEVDKDKSGTVEFEEFVDLMQRTNKTKEQMEEEIKNAFLTLDADGSGYIDRQELVDEETINGMIAEADLDGDGKINYAEFTKIMLSPKCDPFARLTLACPSTSPPFLLLASSALAWLE